MVFMVVSGQLSAFSFQRFVSVIEQQCSAASSAFGFQQSVPEKKFALLIAEG
jgi:hypothetical protein